MSADRTMELGWSTCNSFLLQLFDTVESVHPLDRGKGIKLEGFSHRQSW
jgi:hypothetical protein